MSCMNTMCHQCNSRNIVKNDTCIRQLENGPIFMVKRYICQDCRYSFVKRPLNYGYWKHYHYDLKEKRIRNRVKTSLKRTAYIFHTIRKIIISHETLRKTVPLVPVTIMKAPGHFLYDE